ncbi:hypothetical protein OGATHE_003443 [Ogataea polymorpha]|uniref:Spliceosomal protein DIB1 n=1 Tax=Ogataea polymorpha TaxID=460523 RepID=A0A9P8P2I6_9ASCO|nr:hypothetical protein OGATHE_003443 [Ogataea polymorpha]
MGSVFLPHLRTGWHVDQAILSEDDRLVVIRFGRDADRECMLMDEMLYSISAKVSQFAVVYLCDIDEVPDFNEMYELYDPMTVMFFYRNKHMMCDFGTGNNNKLNFMVGDKQELIDIIETIYRGAVKGKGLIIFRSKQQPLVPLGCLGTCVAVAMAAKGVRTGNARSAQKWFRWRVGLQGLTIVALLAGSFYFDKTLREGKTEQELAIEKARMRERLWIEELERRDEEMKERQRRAELARKRKEDAEASKGD